MFVSKRVTHRVFLSSVVDDGHRREVHVAAVLLGVGPGDCDGCLDWSVARGFVDVVGAELLAEFQDLVKSCSCV
jgi:hypothetical protein